MFFVLLAINTLLFLVSIFILFEARNMPPGCGVGAALGLGAMYGVSFLLGFCSLVNYLLLFIFYFWGISALITAAVVLVALFSLWYLLNS